MTDTSQEEVVAPEANEGEGEQAEADDTVWLPKSEWEKTNQTLGSLKRELKDLRKSKEEPKETPKNQTDENRLLDKLEKMSLRTAGVTHPDDVALARSLAKKWNVDHDDILEDEDFKVKLERQQTNRDNVTATSNVRGSAGPSQTKNTTEYWQAKGQPPTPDDIPDRKTRQKIVMEMVRGSKQGLSGNPYYSGK